MEDLGLTGIRVHIWASLKVAVKGLGLITRVHIWASFKPKTLAGRRERCKQPLRIGSRILV